MKWILCLTAAFGCALCSADQVSVAVASNFAAPLRTIAQHFEASTGHQAIISSGSSGKLYAQIVNGAPFDLFLSADQDKPQRLEQQERIVPGSRFTYAEGRLVLWSANPTYQGRLPEALTEGDFHTLAIANPTLAPYGAAALETLHSLGVETENIPRLVQGENIAQTYQFVASRNADLGLVALAQVITDKATLETAWPVPAQLHSPIRQDAALLMAGSENPAATAFMNYLKSPEATALIDSFGYGLPAR